MHLAQKSASSKPYHMRFGCSKFTRVLACAAFLAAEGVSGSAFAARSAASCELPKMNVGDRPHVGAAATKVAVGIYLVDITEINDVKQQFTGDLLVFKTWKDPRLKELVGCRLRLEQVWSPELDFLNSGRVFPGLQPYVSVGEEGTVSYVQRYQGSLSFPHRLDDFPFDEHTIAIDVVAVGATIKEIELTVDEKNTDRQADLTIPDWTLGYPVALTTQIGGLQKASSISQYHFSIDAERHYQYYLWKVFWPLILIVAMSWSVFWINPAKFGPQIGMSATSMLTLIAFQFAMASILPRLSYFTKLDEFITVSTGLVFGALVVSLTTSYLVSVDRTEIAVRLDRICRWAFPLALVGVMVVIFIL